MRMMRARYSPSQPLLHLRRWPARQLSLEELLNGATSAVILSIMSASPMAPVANDTEYGLSAAVFGRDIARAFEMAKRIDSGICHVNGPTVHDEAQMPFGGVKASGYGRFGGKAGIAEFTELRWITIETGPQHYPI
jgi:hypothetical protein